MVLFTEELCMAIFIICKERGCCHCGFYFSKTNVKKSFDTEFCKCTCNYIFVFCTFIYVANNVIHIYDDQGCFYHKCEHPSQELWVLPFGVALMFTQWNIILIKLFWTYWIFYSDVKNTWQRGLGYFIKKENCWIHARVFCYQSHH